MKEAYIKYPICTSVYNFEDLEAISTQICTKKDSQGKGYIMKFQCFVTFYFNKLLFRNPQKGGGKIIHFQQALFITDLKTLTRLWLWKNLNWFGDACITVSYHTHTKWSVCVPGGI